LGQVGVDARRWARRQDGQQQYKTSLKFAAAAAETCRRMYVWLWSSGCRVADDHVAACMALGEWLTTEWLTTTSPPRHSRRRGRQHATRLHAALVCLGQHATRLHAALVCLGQHATRLHAVLVFALVSSLRARARTCNKQRLGRCTLLPPLRRW